jgi:hypothetical protein
VKTALNSFEKVRLTKKLDICIQFGNFAVGI